MLKPRRGDERRGWTYPEFIGFSRKVTHNQKNTVGLVAGLLGSQIFSG
jgi:hypothetical protein